MHMYKMPRFYNTYNPHLFMNTNRIPFFLLNMYPYDAVKYYNHLVAFFYGEKESFFGGGEGVNIEYRREEKSSYELK